MILPNEERLRALAADAGAATDELNDALLRAEETVSALRLGVVAETPLPGVGGQEGAVLRFCKHRGRWGLYVVMGEIHEAVGSAGRRQRIAAARALPALCDALIAEAEKHLADVRKATASANEFVDAAARAFGPKPAAPSHREGRDRRRVR